MNRHFRWWHPRVLGAWLTLAVHLVAVSGAAQAAVAVLAVVDGSHHIGVRTQGQGSVLVLGHDRPGSSCRAAARHQVGRAHSPAVTAVLWLAKSHLGERDHVFSLTSGSSQFNRHAERLIREPFRVTVMPMVAQLAIPKPVRYAPRVGGSPPILALPLLVVDSVVLLI